MGTLHSPPDHALLQKSPDFSLVLGGPLYQLWRRSHLAGDALQLVSRRIIVVAVVAWLPLLLLSMAEGHLWNRGTAGVALDVPFLHDLETHARLLLALPLLVVAELVVHRRMRAVVRQFLDRGLIPDSERPGFDAAISSAFRLRNSIFAEVLLILAVYVVGVGFVWRTQFSLDVASWYGTLIEGRLRPTLAGWWFGCLSLPLFQFLLLRWYFRLFIWARFLWSVSRLKLGLMPLHPDRCGGLGFLSHLTYAFGPLLVAQGVLLSGVMASRIFFAGGKLVDFKADIVALAAVMVAAVLGPLLVFAPRLAEAKRSGLRECGELAQRYAREFDHKWLRGGVAAGEPLVGSADIQSLADMGNSFDIVKGMRAVPFTLHTVLQLSVFTLLPVLPLALTMMSLEELVRRAFEILF